MNQEGKLHHQVHPLFATKYFSLLTDLLVWSVGQKMFLQSQPPAECQTPGGSWLGSCWAPRPIHAQDNHFAVWSSFRSLNSRSLFTAHISLVEINRNTDVQRLSQHVIGNVLIQIYTFLKCMLELCGKTDVCFIAPIIIWSCACSQGILILQYFVYNKF